MTEDSGTYQQGVAMAVATLIEPVLNDLGYELVEVQFRREAHGQILRVIIFRPEGIGVDDCARVSREVSHLLDVEDLIDQAFHLEVSSPGLDRPLNTARDFARYRGSRVRVILAETAEEIIGVIGDIREEQVALDTPQGVRIIPLFLVKKAKLVIDF
jgi:ribosome maturation factor RimP